MGFRQGATVQTNAVENGGHLVSTGQKRLKILESPHFHFLKFESTFYKSTKFMFEKSASKPVLMLEDCENDVILTKAALRGLGINSPILSVSRVSEAIAYLEGASPYEDREKYPIPVVIFVDLNLPGVDGFQFLKWFGAHNMPHDTLVVVVTGAEDKMSFRRACALGAHSYLNKVALRKDLQRLVEEFPFYWTRSQEIVATRDA
jgi:CheY-like chemotaxis protein